VPFGNWLGRDGKIKGLWGEGKSKVLWMPDLRQMNGGFGVAGTCF
jgi:hypothetical protein